MLKASRRPYAKRRAAMIVYLTVYSCQAQINSDEDVFHTFTVFRVEIHVTVFKSTGGGLCDDDNYDILCVHLSNKCECLGS